MPIKKLYAFTLIELMVTLALTAMMIGLSYTGYNFIQKLFYQTTEQSDFINQVVELDKRFARISNAPGRILQQDEVSFVIDGDTISKKLEIRPDYILFHFPNITDTFRIRSCDLSVEYEPVPLNAGIRPVKRLSFNTLFEKEKFGLSLEKDYDAFYKLNLNLQDK